MSDELVTIAKYNDSAQAELAKQLLADHGIQTVIAGQYTADIYSGLQSFAMTELQCLQSEAQKATEILNADKSDDLGDSQE